MLSVTVPGPVPFRPAVTEIQDAELVAVQGQFAAVTTETDIAPPLSDTLAALADSENVQAGTQGLNENCRFRGTGAPEMKSARLFLESVQPLPSP